MTLRVSVHRLLIYDKNAYFQDLIMNFNPLRISEGQKNCTINFVIGNISRKRWPKTVKFGTSLDSSFFNISADNYTNIWSGFNATCILFMHRPTDVMQ